MARIVIFGGQGYIGQNIIENLGANHNFLTLGRSEEKLFKEENYTHLSILHPALLYKLNLFRPDYFIISYYGNPSTKDVDAYLKLDEVIIRIYHSLKNNPKLIFISTQLAYGERQILDKNETKNEFFDFYAKMCVAFERQMEVIAKDNYVILRVPIVYGGKHIANKGYTNIVTAFIDAAVKGQKLKVYGSGVQIRSFIHMEDFVQLIDKIISYGVSIKLLNTCFNEHYSIRKLAQLIASNFNTEFDIIDWPDNLKNQDIYDIILDSSMAISMVKNKWNITKYLHSFND